MWPGTGNSPKSQIPCYGHRPLQCYSAIVKTSLISFASEGLHLIHSFPLLFASLPNFHKQFHLFFFFCLFFNLSRDVNIRIQWHAHSEYNACSSFVDPIVGNWELLRYKQKYSSKNWPPFTGFKAALLLSCIKFGLHIMKISYICILQSDGE